MGVVDLRSLAVTILAGCTFHEHSMKVVELVHLEAHLEVPWIPLVVGAMLGLLGPMHLVHRREGDILQKEEDNDLSCLVVPVAFDCFQLVDSVRNLDQEDHILMRNDIEYYTRSFKW
jgi:hypothetical protein